VETADFQTAEAYKTHTREEEAQPSYTAPSQNNQKEIAAPAVAVEDLDTEEERRI